MRSTTARCGRKCSKACAAWASRNTRSFATGLELFHYIECDDYAHAIAELARSPLNQRWENAMAPMTAIAHDFSGEGNDQMKLIFDF